MWNAFCEAASNPFDCGSYGDPFQCEPVPECFWDFGEGSCKEHNGVHEVTGPIENLSIADLDLRNRAETRLYTYYVQRVGDGTGQDEETAILSSEVTFDISGTGFPVSGSGEVYRMCLPGECKKTKLISAARNSQFFTVFGAGEGGEGFGDPRVQISLASERVADLQSIASVDSNFDIGDGGGLWTRANLSANEQVVLFNSLSTASDPFGLDGIWAVYSTCSNLGLNTVWKLNLAYCQSGCQAMENWTVNVVKTQQGVAGFECTGEWFGALDIALDPVDSELYISYFADVDGTSGTGISDSDTYQLLRSGFLSIVEDQANVVGE
jgi:hypothetical protein